MYKSLITVALAGMASAAIAPSGYDSASASSSVAAPSSYAAPSASEPAGCSSAYTSTLIYRSTTLYETIYPGGATSTPTGVAPYPVPNGNGTVPAASTGLPPTTSTSTPGSPAQQTDNAAAAAKPIGALLGLAGFAVALL